MLSNTRIPSKITKMSSFFALQTWVVIAVTANVHEFVARPGSGSSRHFADRHLCSSNRRASLDLHAQHVRSSQPTIDDLERIFKSTSDKLL